MRLPGSSLSLLLSALISTGFAQQPAQAVPGQSAVTPVLIDRDPVPSPDDVSPGVPAAAANPAPNSQPGNTVAVPPSNGTTGKVESHGNDQFVLRKNVDEVVLHATVVDQRQRLVTDLGRSDFTIFEDGVPQPITSFTREDIPVSLGILIDNSGSMRDKRDSVNQASLDLIKSSNPSDQIFVVNFADEAYIDQDFTASVPLLKEALDHVDSRGGTALYDAVMASSDYLSQKSKLERQVLLVITDGEDNASMHTLEESVRRVQNDRGPVIYTIGLLGDEKARRARRALEALAYQTGGVAFFPKDLSEVNAIATEIARDIRNQYTLQYKSSKPQEQGGYRMVKVTARPTSGHGQLQVRTKSGYYPGQEKGSVQQRAAGR